MIRALGPYLALEVRRTLRDPSFLVFTMVMPVIMYLLFSNVGQVDEEWRAFSMVGMAAYAALGAAVSTGTGVASDRSTGWLRQLRVTALPPTGVVVARAASGAVTVLPAVTSVLAAGSLVNGVRLAPWQWLALVGLLWLGSLPFTLLGLGNGYRLSAQATGVVNMVGVVGLSVAGGLWFPTEAFPDWLRSVAQSTPASPFTALGRAVLGVPVDGWAYVVLSGWAMVFGAYAVVSYGRSARTV
ncbi:MULTISPECIES: ABC transporter permease [Streptomyces]|uniref:ABC transporter permease n=1 Tax=Streptomyces rutgersensis TaxID=53451 RepID=A0ABX6RK84_9ACTN|nr:MULTISPECIES: ABC transporter permease [Streptomyces]NEE36482.1 ABC transporter permease [Streptomyces sp. SID7982]PJM85222.1 ABC transporter [Streptomyces sp. TSRI0384-2]QNE80926.1 ABC transporter permease [Streptomyces rutgersensis]